MFCLWVYFGHLPTSRVAITFKPNPALLRLITCSFDLLGRIIPELQDEFELRGNTANVLLVKFLRNEIENANKIWASVKDNITAYFFTDGLVNLTEVTLRDGVFHKKNRNFDPKPLAQGKVDNDTQYIATELEFKLPAVTKTKEVLKNELNEEEKKQIIE